LKIGVNEFYGALQTRNIKAYRAAQMAPLSDEKASCKLNAMAEYPKKLSIMADFWHPSFFSLLL
jgi:hypothetical protein